MEGATDELEHPVGFQSRNFRTVISDAFSATGSASAGFLVPGPQSWLPAEPPQLCQVAQLVGTSVHQKVVGSIPRQDT